MAGKAQIMEKNYDLMQEIKESAKKLNDLIRQEEGVITTKSQYNWTKHLDIKEANIQLANQSKTLYKVRAQCEKMERALKDILQNPGNESYVRTTAEQGLKNPTLLDPVTAGWK